MWITPYSTPCYQQYQWVGTLQKRPKEQQTVLQPKLKTLGWNIISTSYHEFWSDGRSWRTISFPNEGLWNLRCDKHLSQALKEQSRAQQCPGQDPADAGAAEPHLPARSGCGGPGAVRRCHLAPGWASAPLSLHRSRRTSPAREIKMFSVGTGRCLPISSTVP